MTRASVLVLLQVVQMLVPGVKTLCSFPVQLQTTSLPITAIRYLNTQTTAKTFVQLDVTAGTSIKFNQLQGYLAKTLLYTWDCINVTSSAGNNVYVVKETDASGATPFYTCVQLTSVTTSVWLLWQQNSPAAFNTSDSVVCSNLIRNSWPIMVLPYTAQMSPIPTTELGGYDVISTYAIASQANMSCVGTVAPPVVGRVDIGCSASRNDVTLSLPPVCQLPVMTTDGTSTPYAPLTMSAIAWWQGRNYNYYILYNNNQQLACLRIQRFADTNMTSPSSTTTAILFTDVLCPGVAYNASNLDMTAFSAALVLTLQRTSFVTSLCADQYELCPSLTPTSVVTQCNAAGQQCMQSCAKCTPTIRALYPNNLTCVSDALAGVWKVVGSDSRTARIQEAAISFDGENRTVSCLAQAATNISGSSSSGGGGSLSYAMLMVQASGCYPRMMCVTASMVLPASSFQLTFQRKESTWPDILMTMTDPQTLCALPPSSSSDPTLILLASPRQPISCGLISTNSSSGWLMSPIYNITGTDQSEVSTVMQASCKDPSKLTVVHSDPTFMSTVFNQSNASSLQLRCLMSNQNQDARTLLLDTGSDDSPLFCIVLTNSKLYSVSLDDCSTKAYGRISAGTTVTVPVSFQLLNTTMYNCSSNASNIPFGSDGTTAVSGTTFSSPNSAANFAFLRHCSAIFVISNLVVASLVSVLVL